MSRLSERSCITASVNCSQPISRLRRGLARLHCENGVEEEHALCRPLRKIAVRRRGGADVVLYFLKNILQRRRRIFSLRNGERKPVRLSGSVIRVLSEYHNRNRAKRAGVKSIEKFFRFGVNNRVRILISLPHRVSQGAHIRLGKYRCQVLLPRGLNLYF